MAKKGSGKRTVIRLKMDDQMAVETGLAYWLEHVVHWYALLGAVIAVLVVGYALFARHAAIAGS